MLKRMTKAVLPWFGRVVSIYAAAHTLYGWMNSSGLIKASWPDAIYDFLVTTGIAGFCAPAGALFGGMAGCVIALPGGILCAFLGFGFEASAKRIVQAFAILGASVLAGVMLFLAATDPNFVTNLGSGNRSFYAICGLIVLIYAYSAFGKKLIDRIRNLAEEVSKEEPQQRVGSAQGAS